MEKHSSPASECSGQSEIASPNELSALLQDVKVLAKRMKGRCKAPIRYGTMLPALLSVCMKHDLPIIDVGIGYYTTVILSYLFGDRVTSVERLDSRDGPAIVSWDGAERVNRPYVKGDIWVFHDAEDDTPGEYYGTLFPRTKVYYVR